MVGLGGVARRGTDATIFLLDQFFLRQLFFLAVTPFPANALMQKLGECLSEAIRQGLGHDRVVVIMLSFKAANQLISAVSRGDREDAQVIG